MTSRVLAFLLLYLNIIFPYNLTGLIPSVSLLREAFSDHPMSLPLLLPCISHFSLSSSLPWFIFHGIYYYLKSLIDWLNDWLIDCFIPSPNYTREGLIHYWFLSPVTQFSLVGLGTFWVPKTLSGYLWSQTIFVIILRHYMTFLLSFSHVCTVEFSKSYTVSDDIIGYDG